MFLFTIELECDLSNSQVITFLYFSYQPVEIVPILLRKKVTAEDQWLGQINGRGTNSVNKYEYSTYLLRYYIKYMLCLVMILLLLL